MTPEQRAARIWHHEMETCEGIHEHAERIAALEELVLDLWEFFCVEPIDEPHEFEEELDFSVEVWRRMRELEVRP